MDASASWNALPSVILFQILSYLSHSDRIRATSTCKNWRVCLYHPRFWPSINFHFTRAGMQRSQFLASCCANATRTLRNAQVDFDSLDPTCVQAAGDFLAQLAHNEQLKVLVIKPSHSRIEWPGSTEAEQTLYMRRLVALLKRIIQNGCKLNALSFGCSEEILSESESLLELLTQHHTSTLEQLHLSTVKDDPDYYLMFDMPIKSLDMLHRLRILSVDNDYVTDSLLRVFSKHSRARMAQLNIVVHGIHESHPGTSDLLWASFKEHNPECEIRLTLIHSYDAINELHTKILNPHMALTHFRAYFCEQVNIEALLHMSDWYADTLRSFVLVDTLQSHNRYQLVLFKEEFADIPDPVHMIAWKCKWLEEMVMLGYQYFDEDVIGIARLRGPTLKKLEISESDIVYGMVYENVNYEDVCHEVSKALHRPWTPFPTCHLPAVIQDPTMGYSDGYILPTVLADSDYVEFGKPLVDKL